VETFLRHSSSRERSLQTYNVRSLSVRSPVLFRSQFSEASLTRMCIMARIALAISHTKTIKDRFPSQFEGLRRRLGGRWSRPKPKPSYVPVPCIISFSGNSGVTKTWQDSQDVQALYLVRLSRWSH